MMAGIRGYDEYGRPVMAAADFGNAQNYGGYQSNNNAYRNAPPRSNMQQGNAEQDLQRQPSQPQNMTAERKQSVPNTGLDLSKLLGGIKLDEERVLIIFLLIILARNGADMPLLIALGYLLM